MGAIAAIQQGQESEVTRLVVYLQDAMDEHPDFAAAVQQLARSIETTKLRTESRMEQTIQDGGQRLSNQGRGRQSLH